MGIGRRQESVKASTTWRQKQPSNGRTSFTQKKLAKQPTRPEVAIACCQVSRGVIPLLLPVAGYAMKVFLGTTISDAEIAFKLMHETLFSNCLAIKNIFTEFGNTDCNTVNMWWRPLLLHAM